MVEDDVFIGPHCSFTNDIRPRAFSEQWEVVPTYLRKGCSIGANATIMCGVTLGSYCMIAAGAVVTVDTLPYGLYVGSPARLKGFVSRSGFEMSVVEQSATGMILQCSRTSEKLKISFEVL